MSDENFQEPRDLEAWLASLGPETQVFDRRILWISRQDRTTDEQRSDLIGIANDGDLVIGELKRGELNESAIMQALSYAAVYSGKTPDELANIYVAHSSKATESRSLVGTVATFEEAQAKISELVEARSDEPQTVNDAQTILLVAEEFSAAALKTCDYLNRTLTGGGLLIIECWRYRIYKDSESKLLFGLDKMLPRLELSEEIETSREKAREGKYLRDPIRVRFVSDLKDYLKAQAGIVATRNRGQSYEFETRLNDWPPNAAVAIYAHSEGPLRLILEKVEPPAKLIEGVQASKHWDGRPTLQLRDMDAKSLSFSKEAGESIVKLLKTLTPVENPTLLAQPETPSSD